MTGNRWGVRLARAAKNNPRYKRDGSGKLQCYGTPWYLVRQFEAEEGRPFDGDCCAEKWSAKAPLFYTRKDNALVRSWWPLTWMNPPWAIQGEWLKQAELRARLDGITVYCLVLASTSAAYWRQLVWEHGTCDFFEGRISFLNPSTPKHEPVPGFDRANALVTFGPRTRPGLVRTRSAVTGQILSVVGADRMHVVRRAA